MSFVFRRTAIGAAIALQISCGGPGNAVTAPSPAAPGVAVVTPSPTPTVPAATYLLSGTVRDSLDQRVIERAEVSASGRTATVWDDKVYRLELPAGTQTITAADPGYDAASREITLAGDMMIDFTLRPQSGTLHVGPLYHPADSIERRVPCEGKVEILDGPDAGRFAVIPPGGTNVIPNVTPGIFRVRASAVAYKTVEMMFRYRATYFSDTASFDMCPLGSGCDVTQPPCN